jgi:metallophosphoesterase (TIGR00282 family)|uniref:TIGR00282 family metallophosphoesterase n=1 Tax=candidate division WOR-3 bacterium TaxID=2052148 RepID=A0A7V3VTG8_UNCW3
MRLLFIGDVIGEPGREKVIRALPEIIKREGIFFTIAQGENLAGGIGITEKTAKELFNCGVDCITTGNHVWKYKEFYEYLNSEPRILRPANYPDGVLGRGYNIYEKMGIKVGVINLEGRIFMKPLEDPLRRGRRIAEEIKKQTNNIFIDFHAEATSEKKALGYYLCDIVTGIIGTHTHIPTADEQIINQRCAYITDAGMVGSTDSIIGVKKEEILEHILFQIPKRFKVAKDNIIGNGVIIEFNEVTGIATGIWRINF